LRLLDIERVPCCAWIECDLTIAKPGLLRVVGVVAKSCIKSNPWWVQYEIARLTKVVRLEPTEKWAISAATDDATVTLVYPIQLTFEIDPSVRLP